MSPLTRCVDQAHDILPKMLVDLTAQTICSQEGRMGSAFVDLLDGAEVWFWVDRTNHVYAELVRGMLRGVPLMVVCS